MTRPLTERLFTTRLEKKIPFADDGELQPFVSTRFVSLMPINYYYNTLIIDNVRTGDSVKSPNGIFTNEFANEYEYSEVISNPSTSFGSSIGSHRSLAHIAKRNDNNDTTVEQHQEQQQHQRQHQKQQQQQKQRQQVQLPECQLATVDKVTPHELGMGITKNGKSGIRKGKTGTVSTTPLMTFQLIEWRPRIYL